MRLARPVAIVTSFLPKAEFVLGWTGEEFGIDVHLPTAKLESYDALLLPGGVLNPDSLRTDEDAIAFVKHFLIWASPWQLYAMNQGR